MVLSALSFILWGFCPMALLSIFAFLCLPTWSHDENVDCPPLCHVIMGSYTLIVGVLKYFLFLMVLSALSFILCGFCPMALLSIFAFLCPPTWSHDENVDCPPLYRVIIASYTLIVGVLKYFLFLGFLSALSFILWGLCPMALLYIFGFLCPITWSHDENVDCPPLYHMITGLYTLIVGVLNYFLFLGVLSALSVILLGLSYGASVHFAFLCPPTWSHDENVGCPPLYHVIMGSYTLIVLVLKYFLFLDGFVRFEFYPLELLSYGAFVHFCFSLSGHVIAWRECWLSTPVSCDHGIVHLDCWSIKIFSLSGGFVRFEFYPFISFVLWRLCPFLLFSVRPHDRMMRMLIVHPCIMWSWDRTPWLLEY